MVAVGDSHKCGDFLLSIQQQLELAIRLATDPEVQKLLRVLERLLFGEIGLGAHSCALVVDKNTLLAHAAFPVELQKLLDTELPCGFERVAELCPEAVMAWWGDLAGTEVGGRHRGRVMLLLLLPLQSSVQLMWFKVDWSDVGLGMA
jgi:hypothetical protein